MGGGAASSSFTALLEEECPRADSRVVQEGEEIKEEEIVGWSKWALVFDSTSIDWHILKAVSRKGGRKRT